MLEKERIRRIIRDHKITSFENKDEEELANIFYDAFNEFKQDQEDNLATKEDIKTLMQILDSRFEAVYQRFESTDRHFDSIDQRFESIDRRFESIDQRFESVDQRFEDMYRYMDKRFEEINRKFNMMFTFMNIGFGILVLLTVLFKFLD